MAARTEPSAIAATLARLTQPLLDAKQAGALLNVPHTWVLAEARHDRVTSLGLV
jgi:hypothetical protein